MKYVLVYDFDPGRDELRVFGPYDEVTDALAEVVYYFPEAKLYPPDRVSMGDMLLPEATASVIPIERLADHVQALREQLYDRNDE